MKMKTGWKAILSFFNIGEDQAEAEELTVERMGELNAELESLRNSIEELTKNLTASQKEIAEVRAELAAEQKAHEKSTAELTALKDEDSGDETTTAKDKDKIEATTTKVYAHDKVAEEFLGS